jgi:hydrogenase large subunit
VARHRDHSCRAAIPRDAWLFTQRICGVCTTVHAIVSVRAVENALSLEVPLNAQYIRNMIITAHGIHDHIVHFYQLAALDWVDIVSALSASPEGAAKLGATLSDYRRNSLPEIRQIQEKLKAFVGTGQLGVFASGYWGHPAMKLPPEVNLLAATHYLASAGISAHRQPDRRHSRFQDPTYPELGGRRGGEPDQSRTANPR